MHNDVDDLIGSALNSILLLINLKYQKQEVKNIVEQAPKCRTRLTKCLEIFKVIHRMSSISNTSQISLVIAIAPVLPTEEPEYSLSMRDDHLSTIPETESDKVIKSSVKNLVPILSESKVTSDNESECDVPVNDESSPIFTTFSNHLFDCNNDFTSSDDESLSNEDVSMENFKIYSNPLVNDEESISPRIDPHYFNAKSDLIESLLNRDTLIDSSPKFDYLIEEFSGELAYIDLIPPGIKEVDFDLEEEIRLVENLLYDNSSPRPPEELNVEIADMIEIDLFLDTDDLMPPGIENDDYDSEGDIYFLKEFLSNDPFPLPKMNVEIFFDFKPDTGVLAAKVVDDIFEHYVLMPNIFPTLPTLYLNIDTLLPFSPENEDKVFKLDLEASRARGFVHRPLELQSFAYGNPISEILLI
uniref:Reverse transcriptase domain-containing protein n=1 Tax=Tanacetum cinerariifolium TaxID=118510 RepID=A0A6L2MH37_TANCI|nr:hypothetical protein [Tanacetum cinerariifolium]